MAGVLIRILFPILIYLHQVLPEPFLSSSPSHQDFNPKSTLRLLDTAAPIGLWDVAAPIGLWDEAAPICFWTQQNLLACGTQQLLLAFGPTAVPLGYAYW